ncbi:hypothetical protein AB0J90_26590 [Micromonospora sp. NPDC049523]|uniref:hypothetical protein n=1 Tax=Micromonospora sp. NPDC049523 TaxID=3155921 RepID=UPI00341E2DA8
MDNTYEVRQTCQLGLSPEKFDGYRLKYGLVRKRSTLPAVIALRRRLRLSGKRTRVSGKSSTIGKLGDVVVGAIPAVAGEPEPHLFGIAIRGHSDVRTIWPPLPGSTPKTAGEDEPQRRAGRDAFSVCCVARCRRYLSFTRARIATPARTRLTTPCSMDLRPLPTAGEDSPATRRPDALVAPPRTLNLWPEV